MSDEEAAADNIPSPDSSEDNSFYGTKQQSKLIRILTVLAYVLSVSLAAILLSIYYIFMWDGRPQLGPQIQQISPQPLKDLPMKIGGGARENDTVMIEESDFNVKGKGIFTFRLSLPLAQTHPNAHHNKDKNIMSVQYTVNK